MYYDRAGTQYLLRMIHVKAPSRTGHSMKSVGTLRPVLDTVARARKAAMADGPGESNGREGEKIVQMLHTNEPSTKPDGEWTAGACTT